MNYLIIVLQLVVALGILNVWLLRANRATAYRGGNAKNMREEFATYGLPYWFMCVIGVLKVALATDARSFHHASQSEGPDLESPALNRHACHVCRDCAALAADQFSQKAAKHR
jgi:hypothetical protein